MGTFTTSKRRERKNRPFECIDPSTEQILTESYAAEKNKCIYINHFDNFLVSRDAKSKRKKAANERKKHFEWMSINLERLMLEKRALQWRIYLFKSGFFHRFLHNCFASSVCLLFDWTAITFVVEDFGVITKIFCYVEYILREKRKSWFFIKVFYCVYRYWHVSASSGIRLAASN